MGRIYMSNQRTCILVLAPLVLIVVVITGIMVHNMQINDVNKQQIVQNMLIKTVSRAMVCPLTQEDPKLIKYIRTQYLRKPSSEEYNLESPDVEDPSRGNPQLIAKLLNHKRGGVFVEAGALDGETLSNSLLMERKYGWTGLLVEPHPESFRLLKSKQRKAWSANLCLSTIINPQMIVFEDYLRSAVMPSSDLHHTFLTVKCVPLFSLLLAANMTYIDYFTLDVEGAEMSVLNTIPFDKVNINIFVIEYSHLPEGKDALLDFMMEKGYFVVDDADKESFFSKESVLHPDDFIFVKETFMTKEAVRKRGLIVIE